MLILDNWKDVDFSSITKGNKFEVIFCDHEIST